MWMVVALGLANALLSTSSNAGSMAERRVAMLLPKPDHEATRAQVYAVFPRAEGRWGVVHVVDRECSMSRAVVAHLIERRASTQLDEMVVVIDRDGATRREDIDLVHAGYRVRVMHFERAKDVVPVSMPSMIVARPDGTLAYVGGHRRDGALEKTRGFVDAAIVAELVATGETSINVVVVGCLR